jgi:uncharacterized protein
MLIKTIVRPSTIPNAGLGCFSLEFVPKDTLIWKFNPDFDRIYSQAAFDALELPAKQYVMYYGYRYAGNYYMSCDNTHYINHSKQPSMYSDATGLLVYAAKDIYPDEELVDNYLTFGETQADHEFNIGDKNDFIEL